MSLVKVFLCQGIMGIVCPVAFVAFMITGIISGILKTKAVGYTFLAVAWLTAGVFTAFVTRNMVLSANMAPGAVAVSMVAMGEAAIMFFLQPAIGFSIVAVTALAAARFNRRHLAAEVIVIVALILLCVSVQWYMKSMFHLSLT